MSKELQNLELFKEVQAEKFYQKKVDVANGVMEMGKILCETKEKLPHGEWIPWLEDNRVGFKVNTANRYMKIYTELGHKTIDRDFDGLSLRKLYTLASAPEEIREDIINNSNSLDELGENIEKYKKQRKNPTKAQVMALSARSNCECEVCNQSFKGMENILQIHHIDGNRENTVEENLIHLCPNCHSIIHNCSDIGFISNDKLKELWLKVRKVNLDNKKYKN